jgi:hypothetical protein
MMCRRRRNGTSSTADNINLARFLDGRDAAKFLESAHGCVDSLATAFSGKTGRCLASDFPSHLTQCLPQARWLQPFRNRGQNQIEQRSIRLWENLFDVRSERINDMRFSRTRAGAEACDQSVSLQADQMSTDGVIG